MNSSPEALTNLLPGLFLVTECKLSNRECEAFIAMIQLRLEGKDVTQKSLCEELGKSQQLVSRVVVLLRAKDLIENGPKRGTLRFVDFD